MNFPDLETCRQISDEFPDSEFVWVRSPFRADIYTKLRSDTENNVVCDLAPAPTCEELGLYLFDHKALVSRFSFDRTGWWLLAPGIEETVEFKAPTETQARAQAVIMVMAALKTNNEED